MMSIYKPLGKIIYKLGRPVLALVAKKSGPRVRVLIVSEHGNILLAKTWLGRQFWSLPGGGISKGESPKDAAARELHEEVAMDVDPGKLVLLGEMQAGEDVPVVLITYYLKVKSESLDPLPTGRHLEIIERQWFSPDALPKDLTPVVLWALAQQR
jgi:8-oxo-dGTP pyrophosphatase MutT (NUDIX family)